jgi:hypothetical protein
MVAAWPCRNCRHVVPVCRFGAGGMCRALRTLLIVDAPTPVAELEQLALDALVSPRAVLGGEPLDERGDLGADRRSSRVVRVGPLLSDQAAVPPQDGTGPDQPVRPEPSGQLPDQRGQHRPVGPVQPGARIAPAQHGDLMPQYQQLDILGG